MLRLVSEFKYLAFANIQCLVQAQCAGFVLYQDSIKPSGCFSKIGLILQQRATQSRRIRQCHALTPCVRLVVREANRSLAIQIGHDTGNGKSISLEYFDDLTLDVAKETHLVRLVHTPVEFAVAQRRCQPNALQAAFGVGSFSL